jgi:hypothetical protein
LRSLPTARSAFQASWAGGRFGAGPARPGEDTEINVNVEATLDSARPLTGTDIPRKTNASCSLPPADRRPAEQAGGHFGPRERISTTGVISGAFMKVFQQRPVRWFSTIGAMGPWSMPRKPCETQSTVKLKAS